MSNAKPLRVVQDANELTVLHLPEGTLWKTATSSAERETHISRLLSNTWTLEDDRWTGSRVLILTRPYESYSVWAFWSEPDGRFEGWYLNIEDPVRRSAVGFDTRDLFLDVVVSPDGSWRWKDEDELMEAAAMGLITDQEAAAVRAVGTRAVREIERGDAWWLRWGEWIPDPSLPVPELPEGWDVV